MNQSEAREMNPRRWERLMELFEKAAAVRDDDARASFLDQECDGDSELRREVESLLVADAITDRRLDRPLFRLREAAESDLVGRRVGAYEIVKEIGRGGLGAVYLAERADQFDQQVALKLIKRGMDTDEVVRRFHVERQILANLKHPNIARLLDGGTSDDGLPYFVMERVEGKAIDRYCDDQKLSIRARLELFLKVCSAVRHAHQNLVVHRDLKPGNILVRDGDPKLLDFGIAKLLAPDDASPETLTRLGSTPMTLRYASPEQVRCAPITTASDVYSLGVLLYELLTGHSPYHLDGGGAAEVAQRVCDYPPKKPSTVVRRREEVTTSTGVTSLSPESVSAARDASPGKLHGLLAGDLDSIVLKALNKEPEGRYGSVEQLSDDIRRHLSGLPVRAREGKALYRTAKFLKRNWRPLAAALILPMAIFILVRQHRLAREAEQLELAERLAAERAEEARVQSAVSAEFFDLFLTAADLDSAKRFTAYELLDRTEHRIRDKSQGETLASQLEILGLRYGDLGLHDQAGKLLGEVLEMRRALYGGDHRLLARALSNVASWHYRRGEYDVAEPLHRQALAMRRRLGLQDEDMAKTMSNLASILMQRGDHRKAEELYRHALEIRLEAAFEPDDRDVATSQRSLGNLLYLQGDFERAEPLVRQALEIRLSHFGERSVAVASTRSILGRVLHARGELAEAETVFRQVLEVRRELLGEDHSHVATTRKDLAAVFLSQGKVADAEELLTPALASLSKKPESWELADARSVHGACLVAQGRYQEAEPLLRESARDLEDLRGADAIYTRNAYRRLDQLYSAWGKAPPAD